MQKAFLIAGAVGTSLLLFGCADGPPGCDAPEATETVLDIARNAYIKDAELSYAQGVIDQTKARMETMRLEVIRLQRQDPQTKAYECAATLKFGDSGSRDITYTVEKTLDQGEVYVTVYGLGTVRH